MLHPRIDFAPGWPEDSQEGDFPHSRIMRRILLFAGVILAGTLLSAVEPDRGPSLHPIAPPQTTLVAVGDILLGRSLGVLMEESGNYSLPFENIEREISAADIAFANLEGPFCGEPPYPGAGMIFRVRPAAIAGLEHAGFAVLSVANNHFANGGDACMRFSLEHVHAAGIATAGAGETYEEAHRPAILVRHGVRFAFLGYTYADRNDTPEAEHAVIAGRNPERVRQDVRAALQHADAVIVSLHDGTEYAARVAPETEEFCHAAIDAGAALVLGHHPHVPQRIEQYHGGWIFYSLGNFVFQQYTPPEVQTALMARITFTGARVERVEATPLVIEWHSTPRLATREEGAPILARLGLTQPLQWPPVDVWLADAWVAPAAGTLQSGPGSRPGPASVVSASPQTAQ
ncbi:MAG TPA: CapA family protein [Candidatus Acidoferrales bacterium]|nr:CapA family protein [Candidatus Acidoferrales bacterium]